MEKLKSKKVVSKAGPQPFIAHKRKQYQVQNLVSERGIRASSLEPHWPGTLLSENPAQLSHTGSGSGSQQVGVAVKQK